MEVELTITIPVFEYQMLVRNDERMRIILDMFRTTEYLSHDEVRTICGIQDIYKEEEHE